MPERLDPASSRPPARPRRRIEEYIGRASTGESAVSIARMRSPEGWAEPAQPPAFDEYTLVLAGLLVVEHGGGRLSSAPARRVHSRPGEWVRYSTPEPGGAEYVAVCVPAFSPEIAHREASAALQARSPPAAATGRRERSQRSPLRLGAAQRIRSPSSRLSVCTIRLS